MLWPELARPKPADGATTLPIRPRPCVGELAHGFLARVAQANGYETPASLHAAMRQAGLEAKVGLPQYLQLTHIEWSRLEGPWPRNWGCTDRLVPGLARCDYVHGHFRWCPLCLAAAPYLRSVWAIKFSITCVNHGTYLLDLCPHCHGPQRIEHFGRLRCACGQSLVDCAIQPAPAEVLKLQTVFLTGSCTQLKGDFPQLSSAAWVQFLLRVAALIAPDRKGRTGQVAGLHRLSTATAVAERAAKILRNWPSGFHALLAEIQADCPKSFSLPQTFGRLYRWLYVDLAGPEFAFLRESFEAYLREHWWGLVCRRNQRVGPSIGRQRITIQEAAKRAGTSPSRIKQLHLAGVIEATTVTHGNGRRSWSLPTSSVTDLAILANESMTLKAASSLLGLPKHRIRELVDAGLIRPLVVAGRHGSSVWQLSRDELNRLGRAGIAHHGGPLLDESPDSFVPLTQVLKTWRLPSGAFPALMTALSAGEIDGHDAAQPNVPLGKMRIAQPNVESRRCQWKSLRANGYVLVPMQS